MTTTEDRAGPGQLELDFTCVGTSADRFAAGPTVVLRMRASEASGARIHAVVLRCQVRIEPMGRHYSSTEESRVVDLFGDRSRWGRTMQPLQLAFLATALPSFTGVCDFDLVLPCSYDVDVAAHKYLAALQEGRDDRGVPLLLLFSGTVFSGSAGALSVEPVPWHKEARVLLPVEVWREAIDTHFPGQAWLRTGRAVYDRLSEYRGRHGLVGWDDTLDQLLRDAER